LSPLTAAIMSSVPARRAGAGSAMNDATRELGAALGVAVLGSVAASRYTHGISKLVGSLPAGERTAAESSLAGALETASRLPAAAGRALTLGAQESFVSGIHLAVTVGAILAAISAVIVYRYLPHRLGEGSALHGPVEAVEDVAELGIAGLPPLLGDGTDDRSSIPVR
jgi:hypothetical protein